MSEAKNLKSIFGRAMELESAEERENYLDETCANQPQLRAELEKLLSSLDDASGFMNAPVIEPGATVDMPPEPEKPGTRIGPYKLLQQIGEGGMGVVYMAEQVEPVTRKVALKVIKPGMDSQQVIARFEAEEQALAMMDHQNIARVLDAGLTDSGRPYFVMELVRGMPITEFCNSNKLTPQQRLELLIPVCHAIQHAHQKGIIHRDIKPSNVLVTHYDGKPVPKVIDFGVAKATQQKLTEKTMFTQYGQVVGTLEYMSPEQAELSHLDVDTRSDVYSLGILLYELLTGSTPLDKSRFKEVGFEEMLRMVREHEPQKPSTKLSSTMEALPGISAERRTEPKKLGALLKGELDWIVMKSLEKDRTRRYESASGLAADIERFLQHEPVEACPPSATYRFRKFARKHRVVMATASAIVASLVLGVVIATWQAVRATRAENVATVEKNRAVKAEVDATRERDRAVKAEQLAEQRLTEVAQQRDAADKARQQSEAVSEYLTEAFRSPNPELDGREIKVVEVLDRAVEQLDDSFTDDPNTKARLLHALGDTFEGLGLPREAVKLLEEAQQLLETELGPDHRDVLRLRNDLSASLIAAGQVRRAVELQEATHKLCTTQLGPDDPDTLTAMSSLGEALNASGRYLDSVTIHEDTLERRQQVLGDVHKQTLESMSQLAKVYSSVGRNSEARKLSERVLTLRREMLGADHLATLESESVLATYERSDGEFDEAIERVNSILSRRRRKLGETHPATLDSMSQLAEIYLWKGPIAEALRIHQDVLALRQKHLGVDHPKTLASLGSIATLCSVQGRLDDAITLQQEAIEATKQKLGALHPATLSAMNRLADTYGDSNRYDDAISLLKEVLKLREQTLGNDNPSTLQTMTQIAWWLKMARQFDEATRFCERALAGLQRLNEKDREEEMDHAHNILATIYSSTGRHKEAIELSRETLRRRQARYGDSHPLTLTMFNNLAVNLVGSGDHAEGGPLYEKTVDLAANSYGRRHPGTLFYMQNLAFHYSSTRRFDDAVKLGEEIVAAHKGTLGLNHPQTIRSISGLAGFYRRAQAKDKARELISSTLDELRKDHGPEHRATLEMEHQLATDLLTHHKRDEAIQLCEHVLDVRRRTLGADHRETVSAMQRLASAHSSARHYDQAIALREEIISLQEKSLGSKHRDTQAGRSALAEVLRLAKRHDEAIAIHEEQLATRRKQIGEDHFDTLSSMYSLATDYWAAGRYDEAIELYEQRVKLFTASLGDAHQFTVNAKRLLVDHYKNLKRFPEALTIAEELRAHFESTLGPTHPTTLRALSTLVWALEGPKNQAEKIKLLEILLTRQQAKYGEYHEQALGTVSSLAAIYSRDGRSDEAVTLMESGHELALKHHGPDHWLAANGARVLAEIYLTVDRNEEAIAKAREAVSGIRRIKGPDNNFTLWSMQSLATGLEKVGRHAEAGQVYAELAKGWQNKPPRWRGGAYRGLRSSVFNYLQAGSLDEAQQALQEAMLLKVPKGAVPIDDLYDQLVKQLEAEGRDDELIPLLEQALKRQPKNAGVHHRLARLIAKQDDCLPEEAERALELATTALQLTPDDAAVLSTLGLAHLRAGHWQQTIDAYQQSIDLRVKTELLVGSWAFNHLLAGARVDQALAAIELGKIEQAKKFVHEAQGGLGHWAFFDESVLQDQSSRLREIVKKLNQAREKLGSATEFTNQERIENTLTAMANYIDVYPDDSTNTVSLQVLLAWFGREQQRTEISRKALKRLKAPTTSNEARAHSLAARGCLFAPIDDEQLLRQAVAAARLAVTHGYNGDIQKNYFQSTLAMAEYRSGNYAKADELLTAVVEFDPDGKHMGNSAMLFRSMARYHLGRHDEAQTDLKTIADRFKEFATLSRDELPSNADYTIHVALVYQEAKSLFDERAGSAAEKE